MNWDIDVDLIYYSTDDWDADGGKAVSEAAVKTAKAIIAALPATMVKGGITVQPVDGSIQLYWSAPFPGNRDYVSGELYFSCEPDGHIRYFHRTDTSRGSGDLPNGEGKGVTAENAVFICSPAVNLFVEKVNA